MAFDIRHRGKKTARLGCEPEREIDTAWRKLRSGVRVGGVCVCEGQGRPACCSPWACKERDSIDRLNVQGLLTSLTGHLHHLQGKDWEFVEGLCLFFSQVNRGPSGGVLNQ